MSEIKRYDHDLQTLQPVEHEEGYWVKYSDHRQQLEDIVKEMKSTIGEVCDDSFYSKGYDHAVDVMIKLIQSKLKDDE